MQGVSTKIKVQPNVTSWREITIGEMYDYSYNYSRELESHLLKNSEWGAVAYLTHSQYGRNGTEIAVNDNSNYITADGDAKANIDQSSTGNIYGIYDLSGGAFEYVSAYYNKSTNLTYGDTFATQNGTSNKYTTAYTGTVAESAFKYGDATYETGGWNNDSNIFISSGAPFFLRGGYYNDGPGAGIFFSYLDSGNSHDYISFRLCLATK